METYGQDCVPNFGWYDTTFKKKGGGAFFPEIVKTAGFAPPTPIHPPNTDYWVLGRLWSKNVFLIFACDDIIFKKMGVSGKAIVLVPPQ